MVPMRAAVLAVLCCVAVGVSVSSVDSTEMFEAAGLGQFELFDYNPVASADAVVTSGNARFTVLTDRLIRMEYSSSGSFEDRATLAFVNRNTPVPQFSHSTSGSTLTIKTDKVALTYSGGPFSASTLSIVSIDSSSAFKSWTYGDANTGSLLGTLRSLDDVGNISLNCTQEAGRMVHGEHMHCSWGLMSRDGWAIVDDSSNQALSDQAEWWVGENSDDMDLYAFLHGHDYRGALADFIKVAGKIAMVPRYALGIWWTRWYNLNSQDVQDLVKEYSSRDLPLDVFVLDMDWHMKELWTGWSWDERLFPVPEDTLGNLKSMYGLHFACNLHDDSGVQPFEKQHDAMVKALGLPPSTQGIDFDLTNKSYIYALQDVVLGAIVDTGMDFWWTDWQQGGTQGGCTGKAMNPTIMLNKQRGTEFLRRKEATRAINLARWGGIGSHRYQVGFSGDVAGLTWTNLAYQPYFSATGSNIGFGFWSHDIEGPGSDHELYVRWVQWAAVSSIFRSHDRGMSAGSCYPTGTCSNVRVWDIPTPYFEANRAAMQWRETMIPYLYTATRAAYDTGVGLTRPLYYDYPEESMAYAANSAGEWPQYMLGDDIMVRPITVPMNATTGMAEVQVWVPPGLWYEEDTGMMYNASTGGVVLNKQYALTEVPRFVKAGAVIPNLHLPHYFSSVGIAHQAFTMIRWVIYPGAASGSGMLYEDDGATTAYTAGSTDYAFTKLAYTRSGASSISLTVSSSGSFPDMPASRNHAIQFVSATPPTAVSANGKALPYARMGGPNTWSYDGPSMSVVLMLPGIPTTSTLTVNATFSSSSPALDLNGLKGAFNHAILAKRVLDELRATPGAHDADHHALMDAAKVGDWLSYLAGNDLSAFNTVVSQYKSNWTAAIQEVETLEPVSSNELVQMVDDTRQDHVLCGSSGCRTANTGYTKVRVEGTMPDASHPDAVPLKDWWNADANDNWVTASSTDPTGYSPATFTNGYVLSSQSGAAVPLTVYYSEARKDHMAVATEAGHADAVAGNYSVVGVTGYVFPAPSEVSADVGSVNPTFLAQSLALLNSAFH